MGKQVKKNKTNVHVHTLDVDSVMNGKHQLKSLLGRKTGQMN